MIRLASQLFACREKASDDRDPPMRTPADQGFPSPIDICYGSV